MRAMQEDKNAFMGFNYLYDSSKVVVVWAPYEKTATYKKGQALGPLAIIQASNQVETYDIELKKDFIDEIGIHTLKPLEIQNLNVEQAIEEVYKTTKKIFDDKKFPVIFGGEHSISLGAIKASREIFEKIDVLQIDAHADMREEYLGSKFNHACVMARAREFVNVFSIGIRSYSKEEAEVIEKYYKNYIYGPDITEGQFSKIIKKLKEKVYITIDIDGFDPSIMPATGTPEPGGLEWGPTLKFLKKVFLQKEVVGFDIVELSPLEGENITEFNCAKLAYKLVGYKFCLK
ncbi:MAG: agmatinase [Candidatus Anstonellaceae archaeon]